MLPRSLSEIADGTRCFPLSAGSSRARYTLLAHRENLTLSGRQALQTLLRANKRLHTAYLLKEAFGQLWDYRRDGWARRFFEQWRVALRWQRLKPYEKRGARAGCRARGRRCRAATKAPR